MFGNPLKCVQPLVVVIGILANTLYRIWFLSFVYTKICSFIFFSMLDFFSVQIVALNLTYPFLFLKYPSN